MKKQIIKDLIFIIALPLFCFLGMWLFRGKLYSWALISASVAVCGVFFLFFERKKSVSAELAVISVMTALSVFGRMAFAVIPGFKPCTAVIIITAAYFGREAGFMVGSLTALISNFYFGQGQWTPFQMLIWGLTGYLAGIISKKLIEKKWFMIIFSAVSGIAFSLIMDLWSCIWADNAFILSRYLALIATSAVFTVEYAVSNVLFVLLLYKPFGRIFMRLNQKYGIGMEEQK